MNITVFGANGRIGSLVVKDLLAKGHNVTAYVFGNTTFGQSDTLRIVQGDVRIGQNVELAIEGCDAVISALGSWGTPTKDVLSTGMPHIVAAMKRTKVQNIVSLTGHAALFSGVKHRFIDRFARFLLKIVAPKILKDGELHIKTLEKSGLRWTVLLSPVMSDHGSSHYGLTDAVPLPFATISRAAVVSAIVDCTLAPGPKGCQFVVKA
jgi:putative NADH-flavin reductase